jgi:transcriptional regulator with XRE-family HTH domain
VDKAKRRAREFGRRLREVREGTGESLRAIERRSGLTSGYLSQLENGKITHPGPSVLERVAEGYGLRFEDVLSWIGYLPQPEDDVPPNQAVALSTVSALGDPSDEELKTLKAIVELLQSKRTATFAASSDLPLDEQELKHIRSHAVALLKEADALGRRPTPLEDIQQAARLVLTGEITLEPSDKRRLVKAFGRWVELAWKRLQGTFDSRTSVIWVKPDLHPMKRRFVLSHEIGHAILPAHKKTFAYVDDYTRLPPFSRDFYEREANQAAVEILFQAGELSDEFDSSPPSLRSICDLSVAFGGSIVAAARYVADTSRRPIAVAIAHVNERGLGPTHLYASRRFKSAFFGGPGKVPPWTEIRAALRTAALEDESTWTVTDNTGRPSIVEIQKLHTGFAAIVLMVPAGRKRRLVRRAAA